jgi:hypothetical protein
MLHLLEHILQDRIGHVADEQVMLRMAVGEERGQPEIRGFSYPLLIFVVSVTECQDSWFQLPSPRFVVSVTEIRGFSYRDSWFQLPGDSNTV